MTIDDIRDFLLTLGVPQTDAPMMARQLDKRARQMQAEKSISYEQALAYLVGLFKQGWAAQERKIR